MKTKAKPIRRPGAASAFFDPGASALRLHQRMGLQNQNPLSDKPVTQPTHRGFGKADSSEPAPSPRPWIFAPGATPARIALHYDAWSCIEVTRQGKTTTVPDQFTWPVLTRPHMAGFDVTTEEPARVVLWRRSFSECHDRRHPVVPRCKSPGLVHLAAAAPCTFNRGKVCSGRGTSSPPVSRAAEYGCFRSYEETPRCGALLVYGETRHLFLC